MSNNNNNNRWKHVFHAVKATVSKTQQQSTPLMIPLIKQCSSHMHIYQSALVPACELHKLFLPDREHFDPCPKEEFLPVAMNHQQDGMFPLLSGYLNKVS